MRNLRLPKALLASLLLTAPLVLSSTPHVIFNIAQEVLLQDRGQVRKNFYLNMGRNQGVRTGVILEVFRIISRINPYKTKKHYNFRTKVGEIKIIHSEDDSAIATLHSLKRRKGALFFEVDGIIIGDHVAVKVDP